MRYVFLSVLAATLAVPVAADRQIDPPLPGCCFQIYAAGVRLGYATSHTFWTRQRSGWDTRVPPGTPDTDIVNDMTAAGNHIVTANLECSAFNPAWPGAPLKRTWLQDLASTFRRFPTPATRATLAGELRGTYQWGAELAVQKANEQVVRYANCEQKYFEYGWLLGYAVQTLRIADEARRTGAPGGREILLDARTTLNRFLTEYRAYPDWRYSFYATRSCVPIDDLGLDAAIDKVVRMPDGAVTDMIDVTDRSLYALQARLIEQCSFAAAPTPPPPTPPPPGGGGAGGTLPIEAGTYFYGGGTGVVVVSRNGGQLEISLTWNRPGNPDTYRIFNITERAGRVIGQCRCTSCAPPDPRASAWDVEIERVPDRGPARLRFRTPRGDGGSNMNGLEAARR